MQRFLAIVLVCALGSASKAQTTVDTWQPNREVEVQGTRPLPLVETSAKVGEEIFTAFKHREADQPKRIRLDKEVRGRFILSDVIVPRDTVLIESHPGTLCSVEKLYIDPIVGPWAPVCFQDKNNDGKPDRFGVKPGLIWLWKPLAALDVNYRQDELKRISLDAGGYKRELIFKGVDDTTLRVMYREFNGTLDRPEVVEDLAFPIVDGMATIEFRTLTISVKVQASETIKFQVISGTL